MKFLSFGKDGGPRSTVWGFWLLEIKALFSIVLLRFAPGTRDAYHEHAFDAISLVWGELEEHHLLGTAEAREARVVRHRSILGIPAVVRTYRDTFHKTVSVGTTYALSFRGPWAKTWREFVPFTNKEEYVKGEGYRTLTNGRVVVDTTALARARGEA